MLTIYSGYHLANKKENITLDIRELQSQQKIIEIVTDFVTTSEALEDDLLDVGINTTNPLVIATIEAIAMEMDKIHEDACIAVYPYGSLTKNQSGRGELSDIAELAPYVIGFTDDGKGMQDDWLMLKAMVQAKAVGKAVIAHCEDERELKPGGCIHEGMFAEAHGYIGINSASEWKQVERDIHLAEESGAQYHICHVSTKESVALIQKAKEKGLPVSGETGPHYLMFTDEDLQEDGSWKMNPPIRSMEDRAALIKGIQEGVLDCLITDHAPHSVEEKSKGLEGSSFGIVGLETAFASMLHNMVLRNPLDQDPERVDLRKAKCSTEELFKDSGKKAYGAISLYRLLEIMCTKPRELFPIRGPKYIAEGEEADLAILDCEKVYQVDPTKFYSMGRSTLFSGMEVQGEVVKTFYEGKEIYDREKGFLED